MDVRYRMVRTDGSHEIEIKKSRFICHLFRVPSEEMARARIESIRKEHWSANHNCTAWIIGEGQANQRSSDDGEPSGTAGIPMLEVLRRREVTDTLAIVTRYFGGVMLGAGGLIRAYGGSVSEALDTVGIVERKRLVIVHAVASYDDAGRIEHAIRSRGEPLQHVNYGMNVTFELAMIPEDAAVFALWLQELTNGSIHATIEGEQFVEVAAPLVLNT